MTYVKGESMTSSLCVDASLIIRTLIPMDGSEQAIQLLSEWLTTEKQLIAPSLINYEVASVLRRLTHRQEITLEEGNQAFTTYQQLPIETVNSHKLIDHTWQLAQELNQTKTYDTAYLAAAQLQSCDFWTADKHLFRAVHNKLPWVHCLESNEQQH